MDAALRPLVARVRALETRTARPGLPDGRAVHALTTAAILDRQRATFLQAIRTAGHDVPAEFIATADRLVELAAVPSGSTRLM